MLKKEKIQESEKIWRISSLSASVDDETKILVLPVQAAKRKVKIEETSYNFATYGDLFSKGDEAIKDLCIVEDAPKRYEDKTEEEITQDMQRKRK
jgi:hypothetical protein